MLNNFIFVVEQNSKLCRFMRSIPELKQLITINENNRTSFILEKVPFSHDIVSMVQGIFNASKDHSAVVMLGKNTYMKTGSLDINPLDYAVWICR